MPRTYNPLDAADRRALASAMEAMLAKAKFVKLPAKGPGTEDVYEFDCAARAPGCRIRVFTSIVNGEVREVGADAIRIAGVYLTKEDGSPRNLSDETRVNRTGDVTAIAERALERMRSALKSCMACQRCPKCNATMFKSKKKNMVCADVCWAKNDAGRPLNRDDADGFGNDVTR